MGSLWSRNEYFFPYTRLLKVNIFVVLVHLQTVLVIVVLKELHYILLNWWLSRKLHRKMIRCKGVDFLLGIYWIKKK